MNVHRTRFVDYTPPAITALAFSHRSNPGDHHSQNLRCAVGRANGDIEIWNPRDNWSLDITLKGGQGRSIEGLTWVTQKGHTPRLFSIGSSTIVTEWSLDTLRPKTSLDCNAGAIWSIAVSPDQNTIALGCEDGSLVMADVTGGPGSLEYKHVLTRQKSRILSLAFSGQDIIVGGCSDSTVKVWHCAQARGPILARMAVDRVRNEPTLVWSVLVLKNGTIVSGDSTGSVKVWDKKFYSLLQNFKMHEADVLCLGANHAGNTLFSAGIDRKMQMYQLDNKRRWTHVSGRRYHAHDVRAMTTYESRGMSCAVTGGVDMSLAVIPLQGTPKINHRMIPAVPQRSHCVLAREARLIVTWTDRQIKIWRLCDSDDIDVEPQHHLVSKMTFKNEENLTGAAISQNGQYLAVTSMSETKFFLLTQSSTSAAIRPAKIHCEDLEEQGARSVEFSADGSVLLLITPESDVLIYDVQATTEEDESLTLRQRNMIEMHANMEDARKNQSFLKAIRSSAMTPDGALLAICTQSGAMKVLDTRKATIVATFPTLPSTITAIGFHGTNQVVVVTANMQVHEFDIHSGKLSAWANKNTALLPVRFTRLQDHCLSLFIDAQERCWMWGASWVSYLSLGQDLPQSQSQTKRKRDHQKSPTNEPDKDDLDDDGDEEDDEDAEPVLAVAKDDATPDTSLRGKFWITFKYRSLLLFDAMNENELVVVERPAMDMLNNGDIPPPFYVKKYGQQ